MALLALAFGAQGASVSIETAELVASGWAHGGGALGAYLGGGVESSAEHVTTNGATFYSVKMYGGGTVFVSSDTKQEPVIAFVGSKGDFSDIDRKSPLWALLNRDVSARSSAMGAKPVVYDYASPRWDEYVSRGRAYATRGAFRMLFAAAAPLDNPGPGDMRVEQLLESEWSQSGADGRNTRFAPGSEPCYNYYTPKDATGSIAEGDANNVVCGCVATAMSQIMFYHRYPESATVPETPTPCWFGTTRLVGDNALQVSGEPYEWDSMVARPADGATLDARKAIGLLTSDAGRSVGMYYSEDESGSFTVRASKSFVDVFGYGQSAYAEFETSARSAVGSLTGDKLVLRKVLLSNLDAGYPVMLGIRSASGSGHEIVADGYGYEGDTAYVHLNMGWSGENDIWYNLPDIDTGDIAFAFVDDAAYNIIPGGDGLGVMSGRVVGDDGEPIGGATVTVYKAGTETVVTQLETSAFGVWGAALPAGGYDLAISDSEGRCPAEVLGIDLQAPVQTNKVFNMLTPAGGTESGSYPIVALQEDLGNWRTDAPVVLRDPCVRVVASPVTNGCATLDEAIAIARDLASSLSVVPELEILRDVDLAKNVTVDFDCVLRAASGDVSSTVVNRPSGATVKVASGATFTVSNCVFETTGSVPVDVKASGRVCVGPGFAAERVKTADAGGFNIVGHVTSGIAVFCSAAVSAGADFGTATTGDVAALSNSVALVYSGYDASRQTRGTVYEYSPGDYRLKWAVAPIPVDSSAGYYVAAGGTTNTFGRVDDLFAAALANGASEIVVVGRGEVLSNNVVVSGVLVVRGTPGASLSPGESAHIVVTNGGDLVVGDLTIGGREGDTFIRIVDGGQMTLGSGAVLTNLVCLYNGNPWRYPAGPVSVADGGTLRLESGSRIVGCSAAGNTYGGSNGGGVYLDNGALLDLAGGEISGCMANVVGGGVYASTGAVVMVSAPSVVSGNTGGYGNGAPDGAADDIYFLCSDFYTNVIWVADGIAAPGPGEKRAVGVRYSGYGNTNGFVFAEAASAAAADNAKAMFFNDVYSSLVADVSGSAELAWVASAASSSEPQPVDPSDPSAVAVAMTVNPAGATNYWASVQDAFASLDGVSGKATVMLLDDDSLGANIVVGCDVTLVSAPGNDCELQRTNDVSIVVGEGASLAVSNVDFTASYPLLASSSYFRVAGGSLVFLDGVDVFGVLSEGSRVAAVAVTGGESSGGRFEMLGDSSVHDCVNYCRDSSGLTGGILVYGTNSPTAILSSGIVTNCAASRAGGVYVGGNGVLRISGDVDIIGNLSVSSWYAPMVTSDGNISVAASASLVLEDVFAGSAGVRRDGAEGVVFGRIDQSSFSGSDADCVESAMNFTSDDGYGYGVVVRSADGEALLVWGERLGVNGTYTDAGGVEYSLVSDATVQFPVDPPVAAFGLVYSGESQTGVVAHAGYALSGVFVATNAGEYVATATLDEGYVWSDGSTWATNVYWSIAKADYDMSGVVFADKTEKYDGKAKFLTISGELPEGVAVIYSPDECEDPGAYKVTATFYGGDMENYKALTNIAATLTIVREVQLPTARTDLVYNASAQSGVVSDAEYTTVLSGGEGTDAGTNYTAVVSLDEYCVWPDGSTNDVEVVWSIAPAPLVISAESAYKYVDTDDPLPFKYSVEGLQGGDSAEDVLVGALERVDAGSETGERAGGYQIRQGSLAVKPGVANYVISSFNLGDFEIRDSSSPEPLPVAFTAVADGSGTWTLTITTAVEKCWYSLYETNSLAGGFEIDGIEPVTNRQATADGEMTFERPANGPQLFWKVRAEAP